MQRFMFVVLAVLGLAFTQASADVTFSVTLDEKLVDGGSPVSGRLVVSLVPAGMSQEVRGALDAPFWSAQTPMFGRDVVDWKPGSAMDVNGSADFSTVTLKGLKPGRYSAAAWLIANRLTSSWKNDPGNFFGEPVLITIEAGKDAAIPLAITQRTQSRPLPSIAGIEWFSTPSKLLGAFHGKEVVLKAGVVLPAEYDPKKSYGAVYWIPGFGGDQTEAVRYGRMWRNAPAGTPEGDLARRAFLIVLDPESPNGHTLFADSDNNGPWGTALVSELIPALEAKYPLTPQPHARLLRGHSSGGWSSIWLAINHPEVFGGAWSSAPDPVDFDHFQKVRLYHSASMYEEITHHERDAEGDGAEVPREMPSYRSGGQVLMTIRQENGGERVLGANQTSGQQWHSWQAVAGPRIGERGWGKGHPAALYDSVSGAIDLGVAEHFKKYDITHLLRLHPKKYGPLLRDRVRIVVGDQDNFYLNEAVASLKGHMDSLGYAGSITIVPGTDHGTVTHSNAVRGFPADMLKVLEAGPIKEPTPEK